MSLLPSALHKIPTSAKQRRQVALAVAEQCIQVLKQNFGATEAIVFGSLRGDTPWHNHSDLDLVISEVAPNAILEAHKQLERIVPSWLPFDLVVLEQADPRIRDRILQLTPTPENIYLALKIRLEDELASIEQTIARLHMLMTQADTIPAIALIPAAAAYVEDFYSGCERLAKRIAVTLDNNLPRGEN